MVAIFTTSFAKKKKFSSLLTHLEFTFFLVFKIKRGCLTNSINIYSFNTEVQYVLIGVEIKYFKVIQIIFRLHF